MWSVPIRSVNISAVSQQNHTICYKLILTYGIKSDIGRNAVILISRFQNCWIEETIMEAWVTLATNDSYSVGALTLAHSLRRVQTTKKVVIMITEEVGDTMKTVLREVFDQVIVVDPLDSKDLVHLELLDRTELGITFTKVSTISELIISQD